ncbi:aldehyde dehydrogenase [Rhizobium leguminosarum bv. trifolii]|uniref:Aldehyde dehydrogenase n=1 Tax=Rhizobium leguminosarum bv. trifolii TaxID=386 RepID=A0A3E1BKX9_RHILT|nr:aldehyde dehydrogenase family protein [Rhizobium leguminosarum]RFB91358.1 aldehyde dehydrogenase [Rhizobium leguminosarum bv. trifolii]RFB92983.1 aldehyde dehydrogenase [Rhizobium leguminosarum bv. trifolii]
MVNKLDVRTPFDGMFIGQVDVADEATIEAALERAYRLHRDRRQWLKKQDRIAILRRAAGIVRSRREELAFQVASESGKPLKDSLVEVDRGIDCLDICVEELRTNAGYVVPMDINATSAGRLAFTQHEPIGVVLAISAFNHPFNLVVHQVAPAVAVGAPVVIKPSAKTPLSCSAVLEIFAEAGLPDGWAQMVLPTDNELIGRIVSDPRVSFLTFIGSASVGWRLRSRLAPGARCALEHGGIAPVIVAHDADLDAAIPRLGRAAFWHAGQACVSVQRVFADRRISEKLAEGIADFGKSLVTGDPTLMATDVGPLITHAENDRVASWVNEAAESGGGKLVSGGRKISASCYENTVLLDPSAEAKVSQREVFGPVVSVYSYDDIDAAIRQANDTPFSFQAAAFTSNIDTAMHCYRNLDGTAVMVNEHTLFRVDWMPFAGARQSGHGVGGIPHTMREMQIEKMMVWRSDALN